MALRCHNCEREISEEFVFCNHCGERIHPRCRACDTLNSPGSHFCHSCGESLGQSANFSRPPVPARFGFSETESSHRYLMPVWRVVFMAVISMGLYIFWWFYITWKHYRDHTEENAYPIWHALTLFVPIYGLFRTHAHMRTYKELMLDERMNTSIRPGVAVVVVLISSWLENIGTSEAVFGDVTYTLLVIWLITGVISTALTTLLLASVQGNINRYWRSVIVARHMRFARLGVGEASLAVIGAYLWFDTILSVASETYRNFWIWAWIL